jgi:uncharacterized protein YjbI with pentapeptide repeats
MTSHRSHWFLVISTALLLTIVAVRPTASQQRIPDPPDNAPSGAPQSSSSAEHPPIDHTLLNQPGPLWLVRANFSHQDLNGVDLSGANLREANFDGANLAHADLSSALLVLATLTEADLTKANLHGATLSLADLRFANMSGADPSNALMLGTQLTGTSLEGALLAGVDARESDMKRADLHGANLSQALLPGANLQGADLTEADLSHADLSSVNLAGANLNGANLDGVTYDNVTVWPANFDMETMAVTGPLQPDTAGQQPSGLTLERAGASDFAITMTLMPQLLPWYKQVARPQDGSLVDRAQDVALLDEMRVGSKMVVFKSVDMAEELVPFIANKFDTIGYNLEHGPLNPLHEQADPVGSVIRMRALADEYGLDLALGLDHDFALSHGAEMAPHVDAYAMQVQRVQSQPELVRDFVIPMAAAVRATNPAIKTTVQVRTEGEAKEIISLIDSVRGSIDGVDILSSPDTVKTAIELVELLQKNELGPAQALPSPPASQAEAVPSGQPPFWPRVWNVLFQLLVLGLVVIFFLVLGRSIGSGGKSDV